MILVGIVPVWRDCTEPVTVVLNPTRVWFETHHSVRFHLSGNGDLWFGDAMTVMHHDICAMRPSGADPILVGVLKLSSKGVWIVRGIQYMCSGGGVMGDETYGAELLRRLDGWKEAVAAMGGVEPMVLRENWMPG